MLSRVAWRVDERRVSGVAVGSLEAGTPPGVGAAIAAVALAEKSLINYHADGYDVKLAIHIVTAGLPATFQQIRSQ
jgi:hypothetical protein